MSAEPHHILVAANLEESDHQLLLHASQHAIAFGSKVWIIHVAAPEPDFVGYDVGPQYIRDSRAENLKTEHQILADYMKKMEQQGIDCTALLISGPTTDTLLEEIEKLKIDLLIMGELKRGFLYETLFGHTSTKILKHVRIPVLIVPKVEAT